MALTASHSGSQWREARGGHSWKWGVPDITKPLWPSSAQRSISATHRSTSQYGTTASGRNRPGSASAQLSTKSLNAAITSNWNSIVAPGMVR